VSAVPPAGKLFGGCIEGPGGFERSSAAEPGLRYKFEYGYRPIQIHSATFDFSLKECFGWQSDHKGRVCFNDVNTGP